MTWPATISQIGYPGWGGDADDCWVVASVWAAVASRPGIRQPTITEYRRHAGDPDDGRTDGGSLDEVVKGARGCWPTLDITRWQSTKWDSFAALVKAQHPASLAVDSGQLPVHLQFGFTGKHQVGVAWDARAKAFVLANPLAPDGSPPRAISEAGLKKAALALLPQAQEVRAAIFPKPALPDTSTGDDMAYSLPEADGPYPATVKAGTKVYDSPADKTERSTLNDPDKPFTVTSAGKETDTATTGRRSIYGRYTGKPVRLGWVDVGRIVR